MGNVSVENLDRPNTFSALEGYKFRISADGEFVDCSTAGGSVSLTADGPIFVTHVYVSGRGYSTISGEIDTTVAGDVVIESIVDKVHNAAIAIVTAGGVDEKVGE